MTNIPPECLAAAEGLLRERFRWSDLNHPVMERLFTIGKDMAARDLAASSRPQAAGAPKSGETPREPSDSPARSLQLGPLEILVRDIKLPAVPQVLLELLQLVEDPSSSAKDLAAVIRLDTSLASSLLRLVNSAYYSFPFPIDTIDRAVALLGIREISSLALSTSFMKMFRGSAARFVPMEEFWKHSICCGSAARILAQRCELKNPERHFLAGLLHDLGRLVMFAHLPELSEELLATAFWKDVPLRKAELEVLGYDHGRFGATLLANWNFPKTLVSAVQHHHTPSEAEAFDEPRSVHLANIMSTALGIGTSGDRRVAPLDGEAWDELGLDPDELPGVAEAVRAELNTLLSPLST